MQDRLCELIGPTENVQLSLGDGVSEEAGEDVKLLDQTQEEFDAINLLIDKVVVNTQEIVKLEIRCNTESTAEQQKEILKELDDIIFATRGLGVKIKQHLETCKERNEEYDVDNKYSTLSQWRHNKLNTTAIRFQKSITAFNSASASFKESLRSKIARQVRLVNRDVTEEQIDEIVNSADPSAFMQQALMIPDAMLDRVAEIEERHEGILQIEQGVKELQELFGELAILIDAQQEQLDRIENNVNQTLNYTEKATKELKKAHEHQVATRKKTFCLLIILLVLILVIVGPFTFFK